MKEILNAINRLSQTYELLADNTNQIFNSLKIRDYKRKEILENETQELFKQKEINELYLIHLVKDKAETLGLEYKKIECILDNHQDKEEVMSVHLKLEKMMENINAFQFNLKRNIEFATALIEVKTNEMDIMFELIQREKMEHGGPMLINEEF